MRILIAEDEKHLSDGLRFNLEAEGFDVEIAENGRIALEAATARDFDAIVLDVMMPEMTGFEVARELREAENYTPILMLTALGKPEDVLQGFEAGTDDYLPKPFELSIFLARLNGLLRRREWARKGDPQPERSDAVFDVAGKTFDFNNLELRSGSETFHLTLMEARLLKYLIDHEGQAVSRKEILENVWGLHEDTDTRAIDNFIVRLRRYIEAEPNRPKIVVSVRGVGYRFIRPK